MEKVDVENIALMLHLVLTSRVYARFCKIPYNRLLISIL